MVSIAVLLLFIVGVVIAITTSGSNVQKAFALVSIFPVILFAGSFFGLLHDGNSTPFFIGFVLSLLLSILVIAFGIGLIIIRMKSGVPVRKQVLLSLMASAPILYAVVKPWF
jgi:hypothetical protein